MGWSHWFLGRRASDADYRCQLSVVDFEAIVVEEDYPINGYYQALIEDNERLPYEIIDSAERLKELTAGQRMLIVLGTFDSQVSNGGVTQFLWNCPSLIFDVADSIAYLGLADLQANYDRALEMLVGKKDQWLALRKMHEDVPGSRMLESFQQSYELLDLRWFDNAYFDKYGYAEAQEWVRQARGLGHALLSRLAEYIRAHRAEFIVE